MKSFDTDTRRYMGCGWERPVDGAKPWSPSNLNGEWKLGREQSDATTCPGYTTNLPQVIEIARARVHWKEGGGLRDFVDQPSELLRQGVEILEGASNELTHWAMANPEKK
jgi:hypothetical protein